MTIIFLWFADEKYYASEVIKCKDGSKVFSRDRLNDNFCDCVDGTDEPGMVILNSNTTRKINVPNSLNVIKVQVKIFSNLRRKNCGVTQSLLHAKSFVLKTLNIHVENGLLRSLLLFLFFFFSYLLNPSCLLDTKFFNIVYTKGIRKSICMQCVQTRSGNG